MALTETLTDNFDDNSLDTGKWTAFNSGVSEATQQLKISVLGAAPEYTGVTSVTTTYDLRTSYMGVQIVDAGNQSLVSWEAYPLKAYVDANNYYEVFITGGAIICHRNSGGVLSNRYSAAYSSTTHAWVRFRESGGNFLFDTKQTGNNWVNRLSESAPFSLASVRQDCFAGMWQAEASDSTMIVDNYNILPADATTSTSSTSSSSSTSSTSSSSSSSSTSSTSHSTSSTSTSSTSTSNTNTTTSSSSLSTSSTSSSSTSHSTSSTSSSTSSTSSSSSTSTTTLPFERRNPHIEIVLDEIQIDFRR